MNMRSPKPNSNIIIIVSNESNEDNCNPQDGNSNKPNEGKCSILNKFNEDSFYPNDDNRVNFRLRQA